MHRQAHILCANVVLEIDEGFRAAISVNGRCVAMCCAERRKIVDDGIGSRRWRSEAGSSRRRAPGSVAFGERARKIEGRIAGAGRPFALGGQLSA